MTGLKSIETAHLALFLMALWASTALSGLPIALKISYDARAFAGRFIQPIVRIQHKHTILNSVVAGTRSSQGTITVRVALWLDSLPNGSSDGFVIWCRIRHWIG